MEIPAGGLAYTNQGNYFCVFYGQRLAWAVEFVGEIEGSITDLVEKTFEKVIVSG